MRKMYKLLLCLILISPFALDTCSEGMQNVTLATCINQMDRWSRGNENNITGAVKSVRIEEQVYEFEGNFFYKHDKTLLRERFEFDLQGRKTEDYTYTTDGRESPKTTYSYNEKNWLIKQDTFSALSKKPYLQTRYIYDDSGNIKEIAQYNIEDDKLLEKWVFTYDLKKNYSEFNETDSVSALKLRVGFTKDEKCRISEVYEYQYDGKLKAKGVISFSEKDLPISAIQYSNDNSTIGKRKSEYEFDDQDNWIKRSDFTWKEQNGKSDWKLMHVVYRKIEYFDTK